MNDRNKSLAPVPSSQPGNVTDYVPTIVYLFLITGCVLMFTRGWLDRGLPGDDFPGNVAHVLEIRRALFSEGGLGTWTPQWFCGQPRSSLYARFLSAFIPACLTSLGNVAALKVVLVLFHVISGLTMYWFLGALFRNREAKAIGAVLYALHPVALVETAQKGHFEVSLFYAVVPVVFLYTVRVLKSKLLRDAIALALAIAVGLWLNNEGSAVTYPFIALCVMIALTQRLSQVWQGPVWQGPASDAANLRVPWKTRLDAVSRSGSLRILGLMALALGTSLGLTAFFWVPIAFDRELLNLFDPSYVQRAIKTFALSNPLHALDRDGALARHLDDLPDQAARFSGELYLGITTLILAVVGISFAPGRVTRKWYWAAIFSVSTLLSLGGYTLWESLWFALQSAQIRIAGIAAFVSILALSLFVSLILKPPLRSWLETYQKYLGLVGLLVALALFIPWYEVLRTVIPVYREMRCPLWFYITPTVFALCTLAAIGTSETLNRLSPRHRLGAGGVLLLLILADYKPYSELFADRQLQPAVKYQLEDMGRHIELQEGWIRTLGVETYNPLVDMVSVYSERGTAWSWLNWSATKWTGNLVFKHTYPLLLSSTNSGMVNASTLAGLCSVAYIIDDLNEQPNLSPESLRAFPRVARFGRFSLHENPLCRPYVQVYPGTAGYVGPFDQIGASILAHCIRSNYAFIELQMNDLSSDDAKSCDVILVHPSVQIGSLPGSALEAIPRSRIIDLHAKPHFSLPTLKMPQIKVRWTKEDGGQVVRIETKSQGRSRPLRVTVSESFAPNWTAKVEGARSKCVRTNHAFLGAVLPPNADRVTFTYPMPLHTKIGLLMSFATLAALTVVAVTFLPARNGRSLLSMCEASAKAATKIASPLQKFFPSTRSRMERQDQECQPENTTGPLPEPGKSVIQGLLHARGQRIDWRRVTCLIVAFSMPFAVYMLTLAPTVTAEDSGELIAAAYCLGVPHPPGYPIFVTCGHLFSRLPVGNSVAWRVNMMSAFFASAVVLVIVRMLLLLKVGRGIALFTGLFFAFTPTFWSQSVVAEVYTQNAFLTVTMSLLAFLYFITRRSTFYYGTLMAAGIGVCCHYMTVLFLPLVAILLLSVRPRWTLRPTVFLASVFLFGLSLSPMLLPWFFAQGSPPLNWGDPDTAVKWLEHIRRVQYRGLEFGETVVVSDKLLFLGNYAREWLEQFTILGLALFTIGLRGLWTRSRYAFWLFSILFICNALVLTLALHFRYLPINLMRVEVYYIPSYIASVFPIAVGIQAVIRFLSRRRIFRVDRFPRWMRRCALSSTAVFALALAVWLNWSKCDYSEYFFAADYASAIFRSLRRNAIVFPIGDHQTFPIVYYQVVENVRPDVLIADLYGYLEQDAMREYHRVTGNSPRGLPREAIESGLVTHADRPVYFFRWRNPPDGSGHRIIPTGMCYEAVTTDYANSATALSHQSALWQSLQIRDIGNRNVLRDEMAESICFAYIFMLGELRFFQGRIDEAMQCYWQAIAEGGDHPEMYNNVGSTLADRSHPELARRFFLGATEVSPGHKSACMNLASLELESGRPVEALHYLRVALRHNPGDEEIRKRILALISPR